MSYSAPKTYIAGAVLTAAEKNQYERDQWLALQNGLFEKFIPASDFKPTNSSGCGALVNVSTAFGEVQAMPFDAASIEFAVTAVALPKRWNRGAITGQIYWVNTAGGAGNVEWEFNIGAYSDGDTIAVVGNLGNVLDGAQAAYTLAITAPTTGVTPSGTPTTNDLMKLIVFRQATSGSDTYGSDAYFIGLKLRLTMDAITDD